MIRFRVRARASVRVRVRVKVKIRVRIRVRAWVSVLGGAKVIVPTQWDIGRRGVAGSCLVFSWLA
jgi:hypothetical protein